MISSALVVAAADDDEDAVDPDKDDDLRHYQNLSVFQQKRDMQDILLRQYCVYSCNLQIIAISSMNNCKQIQHRSLYRKVVRKNFCLNQIHISVA